jgi:uncharacterized membrane protein
MPFCHKCGARLEENARFCYVCGSQVVTLVFPPATNKRRGPVLLRRVTPWPSRLPAFKDKRLWYALVITVTADLLVFTIGGDSVLLPLRWLVGFVFSLILPGYCLLGALSLKKELRIAETICLSVILSFGILALNGLLVNSLFGRIDLIALMLFLSLEVLALMTVAVSRYQEQSISTKKSMLAKSI